MTKKVLKLKRSNSAEEVTKYKFTGWEFVLGLLWFDWSSWLLGLLLLLLRGGSLAGLGLEPGQSAVNSSGFSEPFLEGWGFRDSGNPGNNVA